MVKAVIISAVAGFSLPYFMDISILGIPPRQIIPLPIETGIRSLSNSPRDTIFSESGRQSFPKRRQTGNPSYQPAAYRPRARHCAENDYPRFKN